VKDKISSKLDANLFKNFETEDERYEMEKHRDQSAPSLHLKEAPHHQTS
jgi:hypothetical protein